MVSIWLILRCWMHAGHSPQLSPPLRFSQCMYCAMARASIIFPVPDGPSISRACGILSLSAMERKRSFTDWCPGMSLNFIFLDNLLIYGAGHSLYTACGVERIKMNARHIVGYEFPGLHGAPFYTYFFRLCIGCAFHQFVGKVAWHVDMEHLGQQVELRHGGDRFQSGNY